MWGAVSDEFFLLSSEADMRHMYPILSPWQTPLINHDTERLSNLAKVTQLINERSQLLNLRSLDSVLDLNGSTILSHPNSGPRIRGGRLQPTQLPSRIRHEKKYLSEKEVAESRVWCTYEFKVRLCSLLAVGFGEG